MGLDVSLYRCKNPAAQTAYEKLQDAAHEEIFANIKKEFGVDDLDDTQQWEVYSQKAEAWDEAHPAPEDGVETEIYKSSKVHPQHDTFKIGYMRSSYNDGGTNTVLRTATGKDLYWVFDVDSRGKDGYRISPDWSQALERAKELREAFFAHLVETGPIRVVEVHPLVSSESPELPTRDQVVEIFKKNQHEHNQRFAKDPAPTMFASKDYNWYANRDGHFYLGKGAKVLAVIPGKSAYSGGLPSTYLVLRDDKDEEDANPIANWYLQALDVVVETCEYVLASGTPEEFILHWSA